MHSLLMPTQALKRNLVKVKGSFGGGWAPETLEGYSGEEQSLQDGKRQVAFFGVYDGSVTSYLLLEDL